LYEIQSDKLNIISRCLASLKPPKSSVTVNHSQQLESSLGKRTELICTPNMNIKCIIINNKNLKKIHEITGKDIKNVKKRHQVYFGILLYKKIL